MGAAPQDNAQRAAYSARYPDFAFAFGVIMYVA